MADKLELLLMMAVPILIAITFHEAAHGYVAHWRGDDTAKEAGRLTFNPLAHIDPFGTVILPLLLLLTTGAMLGYAKPVPVNIRRTRNPRQDMMLIAAAGPGMNLALALIFVLLNRVAGLIMPADPFTLDMQYFLYFAAFLNVILAVFNMLPIPPLDGSRVVTGLLPPALAWQYNRLEPYGFFIVLGVVILLPMAAASAGVDFPILDWLVFGPAQAVTQWLWELADALVPV